MQTASIVVWADILVKKLYNIRVLNVCQKSLLPHQIFEGCEIDVVTFDYAAFAHTIRAC
jgi:hypothetical protein